jgi:predicted transposase YdaD
MMALTQAYLEWEQQTEQRGRLRGRTEGRTKEARSLVLHQPTRCVGTLPAIVEV